MKFKKKYYEVKYMEYYEFKFTDIYDREWKVWASDTQTVKMIRSVDSEFKKYVLSISDNYNLGGIKVSPLYNLEIYDIIYKNKYYIEAKVGIVSKGSIYIFIIERFFVIVKCKIINIMQIQEHYQ